MILLNVTEKRPKIRAFFYVQKGSFFIDFFDFEKFIEMMLHLLQMSIT